MKVLIVVAIVLAALIGGVMVIPVQAGFGVSGLLVMDEAERCAWLDRASLYGMQEPYLQPIVFPRGVDIDFDRAVLLDSKGAVVARDGDWIEADGHFPGPLSLDRWRKATCVIAGSEKRTIHITGNLQSSSDRR